MTTTNHPIRHVGPRTKGADELHAMKYRAPNEGFREAMNRVAFALADNGDHYGEFRDALLHMRFQPGGRIQSSAGATRRTTANNCYVSGTIEDTFTDKDGIMQRAHEAAATMRMGGGIGYDFSTLRPRGFRVVKIDSQASGPVSFMPVFDATCLATASFGHRRGAQMGVLRCDHPDIEEFVGCKQGHGLLRGFNISVAVTDVFMEAVARNGEFELMWDGRPYKTVDAAALWEKIMRSTYDWADPGVIFIDTINRMNNLAYCETIAATNPCFTGDTMVWTSSGHKSFAELANAGNDVDVLTQLANGRFAYRTMRRPRVTQRSAELVEITLMRPNGKKKSITQTVRCTPTHEFYLRDGRAVMAKDLVKGDRLSSVYRGPRGKGYVGLSRYGFSMMEHHVPFENVAGLGAEVDAHHVNGNKRDNNPSNLELKSHGQHSREHKLGDDNPMRKHPHRNHFTRKDNTKENNGRWRSELSTEAMRDLRESGLSYATIAESLGCSKGTVMQRLGWRRPNNHIVKSVCRLEMREDVYCGTVDETHTFFIATGDNDGVLVSNCGEQPLPPFGSCLLGSFNITQYLTHDEIGRWTIDYSQLEHDVPHVVRAMDNVVDKALYPLPQQQDEARNKRRMGLGVLGMANALEACGHPYGSDGFLAAENALLGFINDRCYRASAELAREKGAFPLFDADRYCASEFLQRALDPDVVEMIRNSGIRNSHLTSIAPTGTISMTADNASGGIEPVFSHEYERPVNTPDGVMQRTYRDFGVAYLGVRGVLSKDVTPRQHVDVQAVAQRHVDSAVSKTCNVPKDIPWGDFKDIYTMAYGAGAKGCTTYRVGGQREALLVEKEEGKPDLSCRIDEETGARSCE